MARSKTPISTDSPPMVPQRSWRADCPLGRAAKLGSTPTNASIKSQPVRSTKKPKVQKRAREGTRHYDWAVQGRFAERAAWQQSMLDEAATADGLHSAAVFFDLAKAFEIVRLDLVWGVGVEQGFPLRILRLELEAFAFERRLRYLSAISEPTSTLSAVLAGGG